MHLRRAEMQQAEIQIDERAETERGDDRADAELAAEQKAGDRAHLPDLYKVRQVRKVSGFLLDIMSIMFVPPAVGLIVRWADIRQLLFPVVLAATLGTMLTMAAAGLVTQALIHRKEK